MTEEQIALGRRAVACKGWRWMPGMEFDLGNPGAMLTGGRVQRAELRFLPRWTSEVLMITAGVCEFIVSPRGNIHVRFSGGAVSEKMNGASMLPVLTDPATLGCLLALVREVCGDDEAYVMPWHDEDGGWTVTVNEDDRCHNIAEGETEVEALVTALEDAP